MKSINFLTIAFAASTVFAQAPTANLINGACVSTYDANIDYFPEKINTANDEASYFTIEYHNNYKIVSNSRTGRTYLLVQCGTPVPTGISNISETYQIPVTKAAVMETTVVPYLEMIGAAETISLIADGSYVTSPCFQKYLSSGNVQQLSTTNQTLQAQQLSQVQVQFGTNSYDLSNIDNNTVTTAQTYEPDVLGRSSWILYYAAFYNLESVAREVGTNIRNNYNNLKNAASHYDTKPVVAWTSYEAPSQYNNNTASYVLSNASYKLSLVTDAGGSPLNSTKTVFASSTELLTAIKDVDILIDETFIGDNYTEFLTNYNISSSDEGNYKFLNNKKVYREDGILTSSGGYDWFEAPVAMSDALLEDMINVINPSAPSSDYKRNWLRNIVTGEMIKTSTEANCTWSEDAPRPDVATTYNGGNFVLGTTSAANKAITINHIGMLAVALVTFMYLA